MATYWTLTNAAGTEKTFAAWGISGLVRHCVSQAQDTVSFRAPGAMDGAPIIAIWDSVTIQKGRVSADGSTNSFSGGTSWFAGIVTQIPRRGSGAEESTGYKIAGPWWYLDNMVYHLDYRTVASIVAGVITYGTFTTTHLFLNFAINPIAGKLTTRDQIKLALQCTLAPWWDYSASPPWVPSGGAPTSITANPPFQIGTIDPALDVPIDEVKDITCAEVIHKQLRWCPDCVAWFDYTTSPPTFNITKRANAGTVNLSVAGVSLERVTVNPRYDLQTPWVQIRYETTGSVGGQPYMVPSYDQYPAVLPAGVVNKFRGLHFTVNLLGTQASVQTAAVQAGAIHYNDGNSTSDNWWLSKLPQYDSTKNPDVQSIAITYSSAVRALPDGGSDLGFTSELTRGQVAPWMAVQCQRVRFTVSAVVTKKQGTVEKKLLVADCNTTNAVTGTYTSSQITAFAETQPTGLAQALYNALNVIQYEGSVTITESECSGAVTLDTLINLTGSAQAGWATMAAQPQSISENVDTGQTEIQFGPPRHLSAGELVDLLRISRQRIIYTSYTQAVGGSVQSNQALGSDTPQPNSSGDGSAFTDLVVNPDPTSPNGPQISLQPNPSASGHTLGPVLDIKTLTSGGAVDTAHGRVLIQPDAPYGVSGPVNCRGTDGNFHTVYLQEVEDCDSVTGNKYYRIILASDRYGLHS